MWRHNVEGVSIMVGTLAYAFRRYGIASGAASVRTGGDDGISALFGDDDVEPSRELFRRHMNFQSLWWGETRAVQPDSLTDPGWSVRDPLALSATTNRTAHQRTKFKVYNDTGGRLYIRSRTASIRRAEYSYPISLSCLQLHWKVTSISTLYKYEAECLDHSCAHCDVLIL